jgi:hypothetical protein
MRGGAFVRLQQSGPTLAECVSLAQEDVQGALSDATAALIASELPN